MSPAHRTSCCTLSRVAFARRGLALVLVLSGFALPSFATDTGAPFPPGEPKTAETKTLEVGARLLQRNAPLGPMDVYLVGFHPMKAHPEHQVLAHHYCNQVNEDFAQCALFDGNGDDARLTGIEYIISESLFATLPEGERQYWHPHNGEILSGQLVAPGIPEVAEKRLMQKKMNSYGKTWHVWNTGMTGAPADPLPLGPPMLAWSFNRDGEVDPALVEQRDKAIGVDTGKKRRERQALRQYARPQHGVDALKGRSASGTTPIDGVTDAATGGR